MHVYGLGKLRTLVCDLFVCLCVYVCDDGEFSGPLALYIVFYCIFVVVVAVAVIFCCNCLLLVFLSLKLLCTANQFVFFFHMFYNEFHLNGVFS